MSEQERCASIADSNYCFRYTGNSESPAHKQTFKGVLSEDEIHLLRRLRSEGIPELLSRS